MVGCRQPSFLIGATAHKKQLAIKMSLQATVRFVKCQNAIYPEFGKLSKLNFVQCPKCNTKFNLFGIYRALYETNPLCARIVDVATKHTDTEIFITGGEERDVEAVIQVLDTNNFQSLKSENIMT